MRAAIRQQHRVTRRKEHVGEIRHSGTRIADSVKRENASARVRW
jgi:hypothetical protein